MNIVTEITPNPETLKFKVSKDLLKSNGIEFKRVEDAQENKFIEELFGIDGVKSIFVGSNFVFEKILATSEVVVVLPCEPAITIFFFTIFVASFIFIVGITASFFLRLLIIFLINFIDGLGLAVS